jgi:hypothetical protein
MSSVLLGGLPGSGASEPASSPPASSPPASVAQGGEPAGSPERGQWLTVIAGVGVLLLAMGVGVLIGRSGSSRSSAAPAQVISVASPSAGTGAAVPAEASFKSDWPSGTTGFTVQLQTLPQSGTSVSAVEAAKAAASAKGAKAVGALKSEDFSSLSAGNDVIYAGVYHKRSEAEKALPGLRKSFPGASVIEVSNHGSASTSEGSSSSNSSGGSGVGSSPSKPAPPSVLKSLSNAKGKSYEEKSKNLPNVVSTG